MTSLDFEMANTYQKVYQARELMLAYMDEWEQMLNKIENEHARKESIKDYNVVDEFIWQVGNLMTLIVKYRALNPYGSENQKLKDQLWKAQKYINSLGGDWNTVLWTTKNDYL